MGILAMFNTKYNDCMIDHNSRAFAAVTLTAKRSWLGVSRAQGVKHLYTISGHLPESVEASRIYGLR